MRCSCYRIVPAIPASILNLHLCHPLRKPRVLVRLGSTSVTRAPLHSPAIPRCESRPETYLGLTVFVGRSCSPKTFTDALRNISPAVAAKWLLCLS